MKGVSESLTLTIVGVILIFICIVLAVSILRTTLIKTYCNNYFKKLIIPLINKACEKTDSDLAETVTIDLGNCVELVKFDSNILSYKLKKDTDFKNIPTICADGETVVFNFENVGGKLTLEKQKKYRLMISSKNILTVICEGEHKECSDFRDESTCKNQDNCIWSGATCSGISQPCHLFNDMKCQSQEGCNLIRGLN